uniref:RRM domain-containing protein n=1 Tax=Ananas comosus var. bracteatus TaxID=296719 RepID=A0A6V7NXV6_ANACO|nr:unnamed protein product [Ananas comosus var. bracteatus]
MGALDFTLQVVNLPLNATKEDLLAFFFYCGTVDKIHLQRNNPPTYLQSATIGDRQVHILPLENTRDIPITLSASENMDTQCHAPGSLLDLKPTPPVKALTSSSVQSHTQPKITKQC